MISRLNYVLGNNTNDDNSDENIDNNIIDIENSQQDAQNNTSDVYKIDESDTSDEEYIENEENDNNESDNEVLSELEDDSDEIYHLKEDQKIPLSVLKKQKINKSKKCGCGCLCRYLCFIFNPLFILFIIFAIFMARIGMIYCKNRNTDCINVDEKCYNAIKTVFFFNLFRMFIMIVNKFLHLHKIV